MMNKGNCLFGFEKTRNLSKLRLLSRFFKMFTFGANTAYFCLLDLSAAFDTVVQQILLNRLKHDIGITGRVIDGFSPTSQAALHSSGSTALLPGQTVTSGVPQGSVLGPPVHCLFRGDHQHRRAPRSKGLRFRRRLKVMTDKASLSAPGFECSCAQNGRKTHWGTSACALLSVRQECTSAGQEFIENYMIFGIQFSFAISGQLDSNPDYAEFNNRHFEIHQYSNCD